MSSGYGPVWAASVHGARRDLTGYIVLDLLALAVAASLAVEPLRAVRLVVVWLPVSIIVQVGLLRPVRLIASRRSCCCAAHIAIRMFRSG